MNRALRRCAAGCALALALSLAAAPAAAQPFGAWLTSNPGHPTTHGYARIPHRAALNPTAAFTLELWYQEGSLGPGETCRSLVGKNFQQTWWVGLCTVSGQRTLRSYLKGSASQRNGGSIPLGQWTHIAVVFDGSTRKHYINGELVLSVAGDRPAAHQHRRGAHLQRRRLGVQPRPASINEVRLWNMARSAGAASRQSQRGDQRAQPGLVALWRYRRHRRRRAARRRAGGHRRRHPDLPGGAAAAAPPLPPRSACATASASPPSSGSGRPAPPRAHRKPSTCARTPSSGLFRSSSAPPTGR